MTAAEQPASPRRAAAADHGTDDPRRNDPRRNDPRRDDPGTDDSGTDDPGRDDPGYEAARAELRDIVGRLEGGGLTLEESLTLWERGERLADICQGWLDTASARLDDAIARHDATADE